MQINKIFKTEKEIAREERWAGICKRYAQLRAENPYVTKRRVMLLVGEEFGYTDAGVRRILVQSNVKL